LTVAARDAKAKILHQVEEANHPKTTSLAIEPVIPDTLAPFGVIPERPLCRIRDLFEV
jgi:hypothetical protein